MIKLNLATNFGRICLLVTFCIFTLSSCQKKGCTNIKAVNFESDADKDDGSCKILGCLVPSANNYDPQANVSDESCERDYTCTCTILGVNTVVNYNNLTDEEAVDAEAACTSGGLCTWAEN